MNTMMGGEPCKECGNIHPPVPPGQCPMAKAEKQNATEQGKSVNEFITLISNHLHESPNWKKEIEEMKKCIVNVPK